MEACTLDEIRDFFSGDEFARTCLGATIDDFDFETSTATVSMTFDTDNSAKGTTLTAIARPDKQGRNLAFFTIDEYDEFNNHVARVTATVMRTEH